MIREAFAKAFEGKALKRRALREMRRHLPMYQPEDLLWVIPLVLDDLLDTHTDDPYDEGDIEYVLMKLNNTKYVAEETDRRYAALWGEEDLKKEKDIRAFIRERAKHDFDLFTDTQAKAVLEWLRLASTWGDTRHWQDDLKGAMDYWAWRAGGGRGIKERS